jgi:hypothetical protein
MLFETLIDTPHACPTQTVSGSIHCLKADSPECWRAFLSVGEGLNEALPVPCSAIAWPGNHAAVARANHPLTPIAWGFKWFIGEPHDLPNHLIGYHFWSNAVPQLSTNPELRISMIPPGRCALATVLMLRNSSLSVIKP